jgi:carbon storage regulator
VLVLTRKAGESIFIGEEIEVQVVEIKGSQVRLGIAAPEQLDIHRFKDRIGQPRPSHEEE